ncbi:unnamed protein product [Schistosoma margrebowiei]|uniref:SH2 domain-containing protein n=1 Tax=Schistosoma margrebowiei TaxID=48269 RepID=A0AA84ZT44_9TREM|nr:unnamed protein product [Schistosoma margrebowiei]
MFIIRLAADALSSVSESEQSLIHLTDNPLSNPHFESVKKGEIILQNIDNTNKYLHSIKRVHKLIEDELMMEYDMNSTNTTTTTTTTKTASINTITDNDNNDEISRGNKFSRYHEKDEFCTPCNIHQTKKDIITKSTNKRSILTTKNYSTTTGLLYDLLSGTENFDSVYMRSQLVFLTCDNAKSITNLKKDNFLSRRKINNSSFIQRRRKSLKPKKHCNSLQTSETSISNGRKLFQDSLLGEKLSSSSPLSSSSSLSSSSLSSSPSSSSSSSTLSPAHINLLTHSQLSPTKLFDRFEYLKNNHVLHSQSPINHFSTVHTANLTTATSSTTMNSHECSEQPLDLSSASSHSNQSGLLDNFKCNIPTSDIIISKRRRSFAGDLDYTSRFSDNTSILRYNSLRHNSVTFPLSHTVSKFKNCITSSTNVTGSTTINTISNSNLRPERQPSEEYICKDIEQKLNKNNLNNTSNNESTLLGANLLDLILSPACYQIALSAAFALCASSVFPSFDNTIYRNNDFSNSCNSLKTSNELACNLWTLSNSSRITSSEQMNENNQQYLSKSNQSSSRLSDEKHDNISKPVHIQHSPSIQSKLNVKLNSLTKLKTGESVPSKKSILKLRFFPKNTPHNHQTKHLKKKINSSHSRTLYQHSSKNNNNNNKINNAVTHTADDDEDDDNDEDVINTQHSFITPSIKISSQNLIFYNKLKQWFRQMIHLIEQPKLSIISLLHNNIKNDLTKTNLFNSFNQYLLDQSINTRLKLLNISWYRLLIVYLIEHEQLNSLMTTFSSSSSPPPPPSSSSSSPSSTSLSSVNDKSKFNEEKLIIKKKFLIGKSIKSKKKYVEMISAFHDIQSLATICYSLKFTHSVYSLIRIGLLMLGNYQKTQPINDIQWLEQTLLEYIVTSEGTNEKSNSNPNSLPQSCQTMSTNLSDNLNTTTTTTRTDVFNCSNIGNSNSNSSSSSNNVSSSVIPIDAPSMIHTLIDKLLNITKESIIFFVSNQLGDSVEDLFNSLVKISQT